MLITEKLSYLKTLFLIPPLCVCVCVCVLCVSSGYSISYYPGWLQTPHVAKGSPEILILLVLHPECQGGSCAALYLDYGSEDLTLGFSLSLVSQALYQTEQPALYLILAKELSMVEIVDSGHPLPGVNCLHRVTPETTLLLPWAIWLDRITYESGTYPRRLCTLI